MISKFYAFKKVLGQKNVLENADIKNLTTIKVSCICRYIVFPKTTRKLKKLAKFLSKTQMPFVVVGAGSNVLFKDAYYNGMVISLTKMPQKIRFFKNAVYADSAVKVSALLTKMLSKNRSSLEFLAGIPARIGGIQ